MWPFTKKQNDLITIYLTPQYLTCCHMQQSAHQTSPHVQSYLKVPLKHLEFAQALVFNPTVLKHHVTQFITNTGLHYPPVALALSGPRIFEQIVQTHEAVVTPNSFDTLELATLSWDCSYLCPSQKGGFDFFVCGIKPEHLLSYQLFAHAASLNIVAITTGQHAQLQLYQKIHGSAFRQSQLSLDLRAQKYDPANLIDVDLLKQSLTLNPSLQIDMTKDCQLLSTHAGLFLSEGAS